MKVNFVYLEDLENSGGEGGVPDMIPKIILLQSISIIGTASSKRINGESAMSSLPQDEIVLSGPFFWLVDCEKLKDVEEFASYSSPVYLYSSDGHELRKIQLELFPKGSAREYHEFYSIFLFNRGDYPITKKVEFKVSIVNQLTFRTHNPRHCSRSAGLGNFETGPIVNSLKIHEFIKQEKINYETKSLKVNEKFLLKVEFKEY